METLTEIIDFSTHRRDIHALSHLLASQILAYELFKADAHPDRFSIVVRPKDVARVQAIVDAWAI